MEWEDTVEDDPLPCRKVQVNLLMSLFGKVGPLFDLSVSSHLQNLTYYTNEDLAQMA